jgi:hypothetical protein
MRVSAIRIAVCTLCIAAPLTAQVPSPLPQLHRDLPDVSVQDPRVGYVRGEQYRPLPLTPFPLAQDSAVSTGPLIFGGILGGALGMVLGAAAGSGLEVLLADDCYDFCGLGGGIIGAGVGESLGMAFGVHTANRQRGSFAASVVGPLGVLVTALVAGMALDDANVPAAMVGIAVPVLQLTTSIRGERGAERRKREARN